MSDRHDNNELAKALAGPARLRHAIRVASAVGLLATASVPAQAVAPASAAGMLPFEIVFGESAPASKESEANRSLRNADISLTFDGLGAEPRLSVGLVDGSTNLVAGDSAEFITYWNYSSWIQRAEVRIFESGQSLHSTPHAVIDATSGSGTWKTVASDPLNFVYVLRVYGAEGRFDETAPRTLSLLDSAPAWGTRQAKPSLAIFGTDMTAQRNIPVWGGVVTVSGHSVAQGSQVSVFGSHAPIADNGKFVVQQIVPTGTRNVEVVVTDPSGKTQHISRELEIPQNEWFLVGLGDLTFLRRDGGSSNLFADDSQSDKTVVSGRAAFYLKGKVKGEYLITASLDTTEDEIGSLVSNLNEKSPQSFLGRLDPDHYYPVYGDDSTLEEDAPTQGRFYVKVERGDDHFVWGNFTTQAVDTELAQLDRALYGAKFGFASDDVTAFGERRSKTVIFAADPGTIPAREQFRGTGGSVYFLERQDLTIGSERLRIEIRDEESGQVIETRNLQAQEDYDIDYIQGRILLTRPLTSTRRNGQTVRNGSLAGNNVYLVAAYEYSPTLTDIDDFTHGGRTESWAGDHVKFGLTAQDSKADRASQQLLGADLTLRLNESTYVKAEVARTKGDGLNESTSADGGFTFESNQAVARSKSASAYHVEAASDLSEIPSLGIEGKVNAYYGNLQQGFSSIGNLTSEDTERWGGALSADLTANTGLDLKYDQSEVQATRSKRSIVVDLAQQLTQNLSASIGVRHDSQRNDGTRGERNELGTELRYDSGQGWDVHGFAQDTISASGTLKSRKRYGIGASVQATDSVRIGGELSDGDGGVGAMLEVAHNREDGSEYYLNYTLESDRSGSGSDTTDSFTNSDSALTFGGRRRYSDTLSVYGEERAKFGRTEGLTHAYGVDFSPTDELDLGASFEVGNIEQSGKDIQRRAASVSAGYATEAVTISSALEWRIDETDASKRRTMLVRNALGFDISPDWRAKANLNFADSNSGDGSFFNGDFLEAQLAGAYRPVLNDRFNALFRYSYFRDLPPAGQLSGSGQNGLPAQRSQILNLDATYDLTRWLSIGGKYGYRLGEVSLSREKEDFVDSSAHLAILRADLHVVHQWDALIEGRMLSATAANDTRAGFLLAVYRHFGDHAKVGVGYNFTDFSDDLTDFSYNERGVFLNVVSKF